MDYQKWEYLYIWGLYAGRSVEVQVPENSKSEFEWIQSRFPKRAIDIEERDEHPKGYLVIRIPDLRLPEAWEPSVTDEDRVGGVVTIIQEQMLKFGWEHDHMSGDMVLALVVCMRRQKH